MIHTSARRTFRVALVTVTLAFATTLGASADVLTPLEEVGAPGGGSGFADQYDQLLAGSGYESAEAQANAPTVAEAHRAEIAGTSSSNDDVLAGSGYEQPAAVAEHPTQNAQSIDRIESTQTASGALAGGEAEAPQAVSPNRSAF